MALWRDNRVCDALPAAAATIQRLHPFLKSAVGLQHQCKPEEYRELMSCLCSVGVCVLGNMLLAALLVCCGSACRRSLGICWLLISALMLLMCIHVCVLVIFVNSLPIVPALIILIVVHGVYTFECCSMKWFCCILWPRLLQRVILSIGFM